MGGCGVGGQRGSAKPRRPHAALRRRCGRHRVPRRRACSGGHGGGLFVATDLSQALPAPHPPRCGRQIGNSSGRVRRPGHRRGHTPGRIRPSGPPAQSPARSHPPGRAAGHVTREVASDPAGHHEVASDPAGHPRGAHTRPPTTRATRTGSPPPAQVTGGVTRRVASADAGYRSSRPPSRSNPRQVTGGVAPAGAGHRPRQAGSHGRWRFRVDLPGFDRAADVPDPLARGHSEAERGYRAGRPAVAAMSQRRAARRLVRTVTSAGPACWSISARTRGRIDRR